MKYILLLCFALSLCGCGIGGYWMNGMPPSMMPPHIPPRDYWVKEEPVGLLQRSEDWIECGGDLQGGGTAWKNLPDSAREIILFRKNYFYEIHRCMLRKGYMYIGNCHEDSADYPGCGAP